VVVTSTAVTLPIPLSISLPIAVPLSLPVPIAFSMSITIAVCVPLSVPIAAWCRRGVSFRDQSTLGHGCLAVVPLPFSDGLATVGLVGVDFGGATAPARATTATVGPLASGPVPT